MDRRQQSRAKTLKSAKIVFNRHMSVIDCTIRNRTATGALLNVPSSVGIPDTFEVLLDGAYRRCCVVWRKPKQLGIEFVTK
jgi:hypothetical protein